MSGAACSSADRIDQIMAVMETAFEAKWGEAWNRRQVSDALTLPNTHAVLIDCNGKRIDAQSNEIAAGFALTRAAPGEEELLLIAVRPEHRRCGLGRKLLDLLFAEARERGSENIFLEMRENNPAAHFYREAGFEPIGRRARYYLLSDGTRMDAITYRCPIS